MAFRRYYGQGELKAYLEGALEVKAIPAEPGIVYLFRDEAARLAGAAPPAAAFLAGQAGWDPLPFVDLCAASQAETAPAQELCRRVQGVEWRLLFASCSRRVTARPADDCG